MLSHFCYGPGKVIRPRSVDMVGKQLSIVVQRNESFLSYPHTRGELNVFAAGPTAVMRTAETSGLVDIVEILRTASTAINDAIAQLCHGGSPLALSDTSVLWIANSV